MSTTSVRVRLAAVAAAFASLLFLAYPVTRPWRDESTVDGAVAAMSSAWWVAAHLFAMLGFILVPLTLLAVRQVVAGTRAEPAGLAAVVVTWIGAGLTLPYYGAEDFGLHEIAGRAAADPGIDLLDLVTAIRFNPVAVTTFGLGLVALGVGAVLAAVAIWRSGVLPRYCGIPFALGFALYLPQFYTPPAARIGHGVLVAAGLICIAVVLWRSARSTAIAYGA